MSHLPRITALNVQGYQMFPGATADTGLVRTFEPGMTLIIGANGLGKTTLITMLRDMCAGRQRLSNRVGNTFEAGRLRTTDVDYETFADRVGDRAVDATATIEMSIGNTSVRATRSLRNLALRALSIGDQGIEASEDSFRQAVVQAAEVTDYADWLLLIDHLVFVTEDRLLPFWDRNVQRQLLRVLTHDADSSKALSEAESTHISADSDFRNARAQLSRHRRRYDALYAKVAGSGDVQDALAGLAQERERLDEGILSLQSNLDGAEDLRRAAIRDGEVAELEHQLAIDAFEVARLEVIEAALPSQDDVVRYLRARLSTERTCPACGQDGGSITAQGLDGTCFLCGLPLHELTTDAVASLAQAEAKVIQAATSVEANHARVTDRTESVHRLTAELAGLRSARADVEGRIRALRSKLPKGKEDLVSTGALISDLEDDLAALKDELDSSRTHLQILIDQSNEAVRAKQDDIKAVFDDVATKFLVERCYLVPHQTLVRIGQEGERFEVQAFDLDLGSQTAVGESRRNTRDDVSESQRVFIDIAFRISLIHACAEMRSGTIVIDAPEGSLDAVFSTNAASMLAEFLIPDRGENRLVVASNLVEGSLLPALARVAGIASHSDPRLIDLLEIAAPTAAVLQRGDEYRSVLAAALTAVSGGDGP